MDYLTTSPVIKEHRLLKNNIPQNEPTNDPGQAAEAAGWSPSRSPPNPVARGLSHSTGLVVVQHLLTVYRRADNTQINRAIISIIHVCSDVPRPKAASHVTHDFTLPQFLSFLLCSPQTQFSFIPWICKKLQRTCRKIQTVLEIVPVSNGREP